MINQRGVKRIFDVRPGDLTNLNFQLSMGVLDRVLIDNCRQR